jgi:endonuclease YncB( thermonuclease family)
MGRVRGVVGIVLVLAAVAYVVAAFWPRETPDAASIRPAQAQPMIVLDVLSGDTVVMSSELPGSQVTRRGTLTARLLSVDAPNFGIQNECYAVEAEARLTELLPEGSVAWVTTDAVQRDGNGRWLMNVWGTDDRYVNGLLAVDGFVYWLKEPPNEALGEVVERAVSSAAARFGGLWGECR